MRKIVAVVLWTGVPFFWQPLRGQQPPGVGVQSSGHKKQQSKFTTTQTQEDQRGTPNAPVFVDVLSHPKSEHEAAEEKRENHRKALVDGWTLGAAIAVAGFTGLLVYIGWRGVLIGLGTLKAIEKQNDQAAKHLGLIERPWLSPTVKLK